MRWKDTRRLAPHLMRAALWMTLSSSLGCAADFEELPSLPSDVSHFAALAMSGGEIVDATGLLPVGDAAYLDLLRVPEEDWRLVTIGYRTSTLEPFEVPENTAILSAAHLRAAGSRERALPQADYAWSRPFEQTAWREAPPPTISLHADWLPNCPSLLPAPALVDSKCGPSLCPELMTQHGCRLEANLAGGCGVPFTSARIDGDGQLLDSDCELVQPDAPAVVSMTCDDCRVDAYLPAEPSIVVEASTTVLEVESTGTQDPAPPLLGYVTGMDVGGNTVMLTHNGARIAGRQCPAGSVATIELRDIESLEPTFSSTISGCARGVVAAGADAIVLLDGPTVRLARVSPETGRVFTRTLERPSPDHDPALLALASETPPRLVVLFLEPAERFDRAVVVDTETLSIVSTTPPFQTLTSFARYRSTRGLLGVDQTDEINIFELETGALVESLTISTSASGGPTRGPQFLTYLPNLDLIAASSIGAAPAVQVLAPIAGAIRGEAKSYEVLASPTASVPYTADRLLFGLWDRAADRALIALFDVDHVRFLPGAVDVGAGPISVLIPDGHGRLLGLLARSGQIIRVPLP